MLRPVAVVLFASVLALTPGCVAAAVGAGALGTVQYVRNEVSRDYPATVEATWSATLEAMRDLAYPVDPTARYGENGGTLVLNDVHVKVNERAPSGSRVAVRVGTFTNDEHRSRAKNILDGITRRLGGQ